MSSPPAVNSAAAAQRPRIRLVPKYSSSTGEEAVELAAMAKLYLDVWQQDALIGGLGERPDGMWAAFEVGVEVARQNGKGGILEARQLAGLFLLGERLIIHSAHEFATSLEAFRRLLVLIEDTPEFDRRVKRVSRSHGDEGIELKGGQRIRFRTRTAGGGRGFSCDCLILDEAMVIPAAMHGALLPTLSARPNPQVWYTGSAVDQQTMEHGVVFARVRARALEGTDPSLAYFGFGADAETPDDVTTAMATDPTVWAQANPGLGIRIPLEHVAREQRSMDARTFAVERLGVGDWPRTDEEADQVIDPAAVADCEDVESIMLDPVFLAFDVSPDRSSSTISAGGRRHDGRVHVEVIQRGRGTAWVPARIAELVRDHEIVGVACDAAGPAASLIPELTKQDIEVMPMSAKEYAQACGMFFDGMVQSTIRHLGDPRLIDALRGAATRPLGDAWAWSRKNSGIDITPVVSCTAAHWGILSQEPPATEPLIRMGGRR